MARYLDPKNDLTFKRIFGEHPHLLINFLNAIMPFEKGRYIEEIQYLPTELVPENPSKKDSIVDVRCKDNYQRQFIIEMQVFWQEAFYNRIIFNAGKAYVKQLDKKEDYNLLQPVYTLAILNENFDHKTENFYHYFQIVNRENTEEVIPGLEFVLVELPKFCPQSWEHRKLAALWLRFLSEVDENMKSLPSELQENEFIRQAAELCEESAFTPEQLAVYDRYWDSVRIEKTIRNASLREGEEIGIEIGMKKGEEIGIKKGEVIGLEKGESIGEIKKTKKVVINSHHNGISVDMIATITNLTVEQVKEILKAHGIMI